MYSLINSHYTINLNSDTKILIPATIEQYTKTLVELDGCLYSEIV